MRGRFNKTDFFPTLGSSAAYVGYAEIGRRPLPADCDNIEECPECTLDEAFKYPVEVGDRLYFQFRITDQYNSNPQSPIYGWKTSDPSDEFWLEAILESPGNEDLELPYGSIITSQGVGYFAGSVQNLILNSSAIDQYLDDSTTCFRIKINSYWQEFEEFIIVAAVSSSGDPVPQDWWAVGDLLAIEDGIYSVTSTPGVYTFVRAAVDGELVFSEQTGTYFRYSSIADKKWTRDEPNNTKGLRETCYTAWHKFVECGGTVLLRGRFTEEDCAGNYYGLLESGLPYIDQYRIEASFEMTAITTEKTTNENEVITELKQFEEWLLRNTMAIPDQVVRRIANTFTAPTFTIDSNIYVEASNVTKLNQEGGYWYVAPTVRRLLCEKETECGDSYQFNPIVNCPVCEAGGSGEPVTVENSDGSYSETVDCGDTLVLEDNTYNVYVDGVLAATDTGPAMINQTININWDV